MTPEGQEPPEKPKPPEEKKAVKSPEVEGENPEVELVSRYRFALEDRVGLGLGAGRARSQVVSDDVAYSRMPKLPPEVKKPPRTPPETVQEARRSPLWWAEFRDYAAKEFATENLGFIEAVVKYKATNPPRWEDLYGIVGTYVAPEVVNLPSAARKRLTDITEETTLAQRTGTPPPRADVFNEAYEEIMNLLGSDTYQRFRRQY